MITGWIASIIFGWLFVAFCWWDGSL